MANRRKQGQSRSAVTSSPRRSKKNLVTFHEAPDYCQDNDFIHRHYRADYSLSSCFKSLWSFHNETLNIWTHLLGFVGFVILTYYTFSHVIVVPEDLKTRFHTLASLDLTPLKNWTATNVPHVPEWLGEKQTALKDYLLDAYTRMNVTPSLQSTLSDLKDWASAHLPSVSNHTFNLDEIAHSFQATMSKSWESASSKLSPHLHEWRQWSALPVLRSADPDLSADRAVFSVFLAAACICLLCSTLFHLLFCHSARLCAFMAKVDYFGISVMIVGSGFPAIYYGFYCFPTWQKVYLSFTTIVGCIGSVFIFWDKFALPEYRHLRALVFVSMGGSGILPLVHMVVINPGGLSSQDVHHLLLSTTVMLIIYGAGAAVFAFRVPERWFPGKFDIWFHSHQWLHIAVIAAALVHYYGNVLTFHHRLTHPCPPDLLL